MSTHVAIEFVSSLTSTDSLNKSDHLAHSQGNKPLPSSIITKHLRLGALLALLALCVSLLGYATSNIAVSKERSSSRYNQVYHYGILFTCVEYERTDGANPSDVPPNRCSFNNPAVGNTYGHVITEAGLSLQDLVPAHFLMQVMCVCLLFYQAYTARGSIHSPSSCCKVPGKILFDINTALLAGCWFVSLNVMAMSANMSFGVCKLASDFGRNLLTCHVDYGFGLLVVSTALSLASLVAVLRLRVSS